MADEANKLFGFRENDAQALKAIATAYQLGSPYKGQTNDGAFRGGNAAGLWLMEATTVIGPASGATFGTGTAKIKKVSGIAIADHSPGGFNVTQIVNNLFENSIGIGRRFICSRTLDGQLWVTNIWGLKSSILFELSSNLLTTDATASATFDDQFGDGVENGQSTVPTLNNLPASSNYVFDGSAGAKGVAIIDDPFVADANAVYTIIQMECSTAAAGGGDEGGGDPGGGGGGVTP